MPAKISIATGNFADASTWGVVDATSLLDSEVGSTALTTAYVESAAFTPGAITIDGIAIKLAARVASPTGTISVRLAQAGATVAGTEVAINVSDLPTCSVATNEGGWILFKFASPVLLIAATAYTVSAKCSVASEATLYRNVTAGNWSRMLRTTTTGAPSATDQLDVLGEHTGAGTGNNITITMENTATTDFGSGTDASTCIAICKRGTLDYAYAAATNYYLKLSGNIIVYNGGTFTIGTVANPIPRGSTAVLEFDPVADGGMGLIVRNGATFTAQGLSRTSGKNVVSCKLNTDEAVGQTVLGVDTDTGWLSGDEIGIASTSQTAAQSETRTLSVNASATELTVSAGLTNAHSGTSPTQAEIILLTRNIQIRSVSTSIMSYVNLKATSTIDVDWVRFRYLGENAITKRGIEVESTTGSCNIQYSSLCNFEDWGLYLNSASGSNIVFSNNCCYSIITIGSCSSVYVTASSGVSTFDNNIFILCYGGSSGDAHMINLVDNGVTFTNNTVAGCCNGITFYQVVAFTESNAPLGTFSGNTIHSCSAVGFGLTGAIGTISNLIIWRCTTSGMDLRGSANNIIFDTLTMFGNSGENIEVITNYAKLTFINFVSNGDSSFATTTGITITSGIFTEIELINSNFSTVSGIKTAHTNDINITLGYVRIIANNCKFGGTNEVANQSNLFIGSFIKSQKHDQTAGNHKSWFKYGIISTDTTIFRTASPSARLTPNNATYKLESGSFKVNINSGQTCTPSVYVRESVVGDGTDYNGARIRLILKRNDAIGITADTVNDTATVASEGAFEAIGEVTAAVTDNGVMEFVIDCSGTTGWVNVDDFSATVA